MYCSKCGTKQNEGEKFCPKCGTRFEEAISTTVEPVADNKDGEPLSPKKKSKKSVKEKPYVSKYITDTEALIKEAEKGNVTALLRLAYRYERGFGVKQDKEKAENLYKEVERKGYPKDFIDTSFFTEINRGEHWNIEGTSIVPPHRYISEYREDTQTGKIDIRYYTREIWDKRLINNYNNDASLYGFSPINVSRLGSCIEVVEGSYVPMNYKEINFWEKIFGPSKQRQNEDTYITETNTRMGKAFNKICDLCEKYEITYEEDDRINAKTLVYIQDLLLEYADREERKLTDKKSLSAWFISELRELQNRFPYLLYNLCPPDMGMKEANLYMKNLKDKVRSCYYPIIPNDSYDKFTDVIGNKLIQTPSFKKIDNDDDDDDEYMETSDHTLLLSLLLSIPVKKVKFTFVDIGKNLNMDFLIRYIPSPMYRVITKEHDLEDLIDVLDKRIIERKKQYGNYPKYCLKNKELPVPYEFIMLEHDYGKSLIETEKLNHIIKYGSQCGIYLNMVEFYDDEIEQDDTIETENTENYLVRYTSIMGNKNLLKACLDYINKEVEAEDEAPILTYDFSRLADNGYEERPNTIIVPVGKSDKEVHFRMDSVNHVHSFIIGQSGSGKSVFLHNIIGSAILRYAPEDLQLYLLDFKLGGVEFNRYKGVKHVKSLLVDNSDQQITLEILRELRDSMTERGRLLRAAGVSNLSEYNDMNPTKTLPQILLIVDECHEMFRVGNDIPRAVSNEITEIVTKIAKEGRSQGVHLILATQTLSGTEISNEILNNISDHYLLKCAPTDSEHLVEGSSEITNKLVTGQIYYHHVDSQAQFQAYYMDRKNAETQIKLAREKANGHKSNGEFYFNGSQLFKLDRTVLGQNGASGRYLTAYAGKNISIRQNDIAIRLRKDYSENILLLGLNDEGQVTRTTMNILVSLLFAAREAGRDIAFKVLNCLPDEESVCSRQLERMEEEGYCEIIEGRKNRGVFLRRLAEDISEGTARETILLILGQERFRELRMDLEIDEAQKRDDESPFGLGDFSFGNGDSPTRVSSFRQAMETILDKGSEQGVHVVMQLDKPSNFLFSDYITPKMVYSKFKHLVMLKSEETASAILRLSDNIRLETLSKDTERLRAYYYAEESDSYTLFTPYQRLDENEILELLK